MLQERLGVEDLAVYDGQILGSIAPSISQPVHRDASLLTLNIAFPHTQIFREEACKLHVLRITVDILFA
jgi:hypothetical protein